MKNRLLAIGGLVTLLGTTTAFGVLAQGGATPPSAPAPIGRRLNGPRREKHPELRRAMRALMRAKSDLQNGARDFSGHRAKAEQLTEQAIQEVRAALQSDKN